MKLNYSKIAISASFFSMVLVFQNCSNAKFTVDPSSKNLYAATGGDDPTCRLDTVSSSNIVKVLFVVDTSGSNAGDGVPVATDPQKAWRSSTISNFIDAYKNKSNFYYGMLTFQGTSASPQIKVNSSGVFTNDMSVVDAGVSSFMSTADRGNTPYKAALSLAKSIIASDLSVNASQHAAYVMVMISDGQATDYKSADEVIPDASAIRALAPGQVSLNTVYYYPTVFEESNTAYLRNIASIGGGQFLTAESGQTLKLDSAVQVPGMSCQ